MAPLSNTSSTVHLGYSYACIYQIIVEDFDVEIHQRLVVTFFSKFFFDTVVILFYQLLLKTLKKRVFFPVVWQMYVGQERKMYFLPILDAALPLF